MKRLPGPAVSPLFAMLLAVMLVLLGPLEASTAYAGQTGLIDNNTFVTEASGHTIVWSSPWLYNNAGKTSGGTGEYLSLKSGTIDRLSMIFFSDPYAVDPANQYVESYLSGLAEDYDDVVRVSQGADESAAYALVLLKSAATTFGFFLLLQPAPGGQGVLVYGFFSLLPSFGNEMKSAQDHVTIDGAPVLAGIEPSGLQKQLTEAAGTQAPSVTPTTAASDQDLAALGLVGDRSYQSPQFKTKVTWGSKWKLATADGKPHIASDTAQEQDVLELTRTTGGIGYVLITILPARGVLANEYAARWADPHYVLRMGFENTKVVLTDKAAKTSAMVVTYTSTSSGNRYLQVREAHEINGGDAIMLVYVMTTPVSAPVILPAVEQEIKLDGQPILQTLTAQEILAALT